MIYSIANDIFLDYSEETLGLIDKIWINSKGRHFFYIGSFIEYENIQKSEWYKTLRQSSKDNIDLYFTESANKKRREISVIVSSSGENTFLLGEAEEILSKKFSIILENIENDKYFIEALLRCFKKESELINLHYQMGWLIFENGGGNNIPNVINERKRRYDGNKFNFPKDSSKYLRMFILLDSDKEFPSTDEIALDKQKILNTIKENQIPYWVTYKREMENYMPDEVIAEIPYNDNYIRAYLKLKPEQKDFFDIEKGFPDINFEKLKDGIKVLYSNLKTDEIYKILRKEKMNLYSLYPKRVNFKSEFPQLFNSPKIDRAALSKRANSNELEEILQKISQLL